MIKNFDGKSPQIHSSAYIADSAIIIGDVRLEANTSVWYGAVLRGDINYIEIGEGSNIQDLCVIHVDKDRPATIGNDVTIGHSAVIHGCTIENRCLIGIGAVVLDGAVIGEGSIVAANALVPPGKKIKPRSLVGGIPATTMRTISDDEFENLKHHAESYAEYAKMHKEI